MSLAPDLAPPVAPGPAASSTITAGSLVLEPLFERHAEEMFVVLGDPALYEFEGEPPVSVAALRQRYRRLQTRTSPDGSEQWLNWVIRRADGELAGYLQATVLAHGQAYVAYAVASRFWRQGIASTAVAAMLADLVASHGVREFFATLKARNHRSLGLLRKLGFAPLAEPSQAPWPLEPGELVMRRRADRARKPRRRAQAVAAR